MDNNNNIKRMNRIMEDLAQMGSSNLDEIKKDMIDQGEDPETIRKQGIDLVKRLKGQMRLSMAEAKRQVTIGKLESLREEARRRIQEKGEDAKELIKKLIGESGEELSVSFRKVESMSDDEALELLTEAQLIELLDEMSDE